MHRHQLGAIREGRFHLDFMEHLRDAFHNLIARQHGRAIAHQLRHAAAIARTLHHEIRNQRHGFGEVHFQAAFQAPSRHDRRHGNHQLVFFTRGQVHGVGFRNRCAIIMGFSASCRP